MEMPKEYRCEDVFNDSNAITKKCNDMLNEGFIFINTLYFSLKCVTLLFAKY